MLLTKKPRKPLRTLGPRHAIQPILRRAPRRMGTPVSCRNYLEVVETIITLEIGRKGLEWRQMTRVHARADHPSNGKLRPVRTAAYAKGLTLYGVGKGTGKDRMLDVIDTAFGLGIRFVGLDGGYFDGLWIPRGCLAQSICGDNLAQCHLSRE